MPLDVAVQIVNYDTKRWLGACLRAVERDLAEAPLDARVLVLDNASADDLSDLAARHPAVEFHRAEDNLGFGGGQNRLAGLHDARALLLLNPDTELAEPGTIARLLAVLDSDPALAAVGPMLVGADGRPQRWDHGELQGPLARLARAAGHSHWAPRTEAADVAWVSGACALVTRNAFDVVAGFDPAFFLYKEEEDLFLRIRAGGGRVRYEPGIAALHHGTVSAGRDRHLQDSVDLYRRKHVPSRFQRAAMPALHRQVVAWEGRLRRVAELGRRRGR